MKINFSDSNRSVINIKATLIILATILIGGIAFSVIQITTASPAAPNPGHSWSQIGDFPSGCTSGRYISALGTTPTCTAEVGDISGVTAGSGLTGGGTSGDVTLDVGAGTGISVAADTVGLSYPSKSCSSGYAVQSFNLGSSAAPTCVVAGGGGGTLSCTLVTGSYTGSGATLYSPANVNCATGDIRTGGGCSCHSVGGSGPSGDLERYITWSYPTTNGWRCACQNDDQNTWSTIVKTYVVCCKIQ